MKKHYFLPLAIFFLLASPLLAQQRTLIHCGNLLDGVRNDLQREMTVIVEGTKITAIQKGARPRCVLARNGRVHEVQLYATNIDKVEQTYTMS